MVINKTPIDSIYFHLNWLSRYFHSVFASSCQLFLNVIRPFSLFTPSEVARVKLVSIRISLLLFLQIILDNFKIINDVFLAFNERVLILQLFFQMPKLLTFHRVYGTIFQV